MIMVVWVELQKYEKKGNEDADELRFLVKKERKQKTALGFWCFLSWYSRSGPVLGLSVCNHLALPDGKCPTCLAHRNPLKLGESCSFNVQSWSETFTTNREQQKTRPNSYEVGIPQCERYSTKPEPTHITH